MANLLGATNPVPGYDNSSINRNIPISPENTHIQNVTDPSRVGRADNRTEQQDSASADAGQIRYDSNFQTFLQRLRETSDLTQTMMKIMLGKGTVVSSGLSEGIANEISQALEMLRMDQDKLLEFISGQMKSGSRFGGALFALLRSAYSRASSDAVRSDILQFLKSYSDYSSTSHIEGNILRNLDTMADAMPESWAGKLRELLGQLQNGVAAGDRKGNMLLLQREVFPYMSSYVEQTHDMGLPRTLLTLLALDAARYENGSVENLLQSFHRLNGYGTMKEQLGGIDDQALMNLLKSNEFSLNSPANQFADHLANAASMAMRGEGSAQVQQVLQQLVAAMLINESVYMPVNHFLLPIEMDGRMLFSEFWVDPDAEDDESGNGRGGITQKFLLKMDVQSLGVFDVVFTNRDLKVDMSIFCPDTVAPFTKMIEGDISKILLSNGLTPDVTVRRMERPITLTEVFPKIFEGKNSVNVKV